MSFGAIQYLVQKLIIFPSFIQLEHAEAKTNLTRITEAIIVQQGNLDILSHDWGSWDDTYKFIVDQNEEYIRSNLIDETLINSKLDLMFFYNIKHKLVWKIVYDPEKKQAATTDAIREVIAKQVRPHIIFSEPMDGLATTPLMGIVIVEDRLLLLSVRPIITSDNRGPMRGYLIFGRYLTKERIDVIKNQTKLDFQLHPTSQEEIGSDEVSGIVIKEINTKKLMISTHITGFDNQPILRLEATFPRKTSQNGRTSIFYAIVSIILLNLLVLIIVLLLLQRTVLQPISQLALHMLEITEGKSNATRLPESRNDEVGMLAHSYNTMLHQIKAKSDQLSQQANQDQLTKLPNRHRLWEYFDNEWDRCKRDKKSLAILMVDIDLFKPYNDQYGHLAGDKCLHTVARIIDSCANRPADLAARYGGEEFAIVLPDTTDEGAYNIAEKIIKQLSIAGLEHKCSEVSEFVTVSIGLASTVPTKTLKKNDLFHKADLALYSSKNKGRNQISINQ